MEFTANQIALLVNGTVVGDGNVTVNTFAKIEDGHQGAISFLANPKYTHFLYETKSSIAELQKIDNGVSLAACQFLAAINLIAIVSIYVHHLPI